MCLSADTFHPFILFILPYLFQVFCVASGALPGAFFTFAIAAFISNLPMSSKLRSLLIFSFSLVLLPTIQGCAVASATAGAAISITGAVVSTGIKVTGAVVEAGIDAVSDDDDIDD